LSTRSKNIVNITTRAALVKDAPETNFRFQGGQVCRHKGAEELSTPRPRSRRRGVLLVWLGFPGAALQLELPRICR